MLMVSLIFGTMSFAWFGWGQEDPPARWRPLLGVGSVLGALVAIGSGILAWQNWSAPTVFDGGSAGIGFGIIVLIEVLFCGIGAFVLTRRGQARYLSVWIAAVVGLHFIPLIFFFHDLLLILPSVAVPAVALLALRIGRRGTLTPSAVTGLGTGPVLLVTAGISLLRALPVL
jgi:hypothetical protein